MSTPPYLPENLKADFPELKKASDYIMADIMAKIQQQAKLEPKMSLVFQMGFEMGFMCGISFVRDNPHQATKP